MIRKTPLCIYRSILDQYLDIIIVRINMANIEEILDNIQDEAASNCNQSPVEVIPYENTLIIQHKLATRILNFIITI